MFIALSYLFRGLGQLWSLPEWEKCEARVEDTNTGKNTRILLYYDRKTFYSAGPSKTMITFNGTKKINLCRQTQQTVTSMYTDQFSKTFCRN